MSPNFCLKSADVGYILAKHGKIYITYTNSYSSGIGLQGMQIGTYEFLWYIIGCITNMLPKIIVAWVQARISGPVLRESPAVELLLI